jgi:hypothetical protein
MTKQNENNQQTDEDERAPHRVRLPGFIGDEDIGLGDVIKRATSYFGVRPCGGCEQRRIALNRWMAFTNARRR